MTFRKEELTTNLIYDKLAKTYAGDFGETYTQNLKYFLILGVARPESVCLDLGIANGLFSIPLAPNVRSIHGVDISPAMLEECRKKCSSAGVTNIELHQMSAAKLDFDSQMFDLVYSFSTLLLVPSPEYCYSEIARVLKPGGTAILDITGTYNLSRIYWGRYYRRHGHFGVNHYFFDEIGSLFRSLGFEIIEAHATGLMDQWKYVPLIRYLTFFDKIFHKSAATPDIDYRVSQLFPKIANRWYFKLRKKAA